jgi:hypothetical protein
MERLPYIDEHGTHVGATPERTWAALQHVVAGHLTLRLPGPLVRLWGLEPAAGFAIAEEDAPRRMALRGRHRFARYELAFELDPAPGGVTVRARTSAAFPGLKGRLYRALVIDSRGHVLAVRRVLRQITRAAERQA